MSYVDPIDINLFNLGDLGTFQSRDVTNSIVSFDVSLTLGPSSQISVGVIDPDFAQARANYFQIRRDIFYRNMFFEISAVEVQRSESIHPLYTLECRSKAVQLMKRDKKPEAYRGMTAFDFASAIAKRFNLKFVGERTTKKQSIVKGKSRNADDSVWTVLQSLASEQKFVCFESEGTLFFCSEQFLLGKWGDPKCTYGDFKFIPFIYPEATDNFFREFNSKYILLDMPTVRRSDDDIKAAEGSLVVDRLNGIYLRPGMTIYLGGIPDFEGFYIITDVQFQEGVPDPVRVSFRVPVDPTKESISTSTAQGSSATAGSSGSNPIGDTPGGQTVGSSGYTVIGVEFSRNYAGKALEFLKYRGPNANIIKKAISESVGKLIKRTSTVEAERSVLKSYPGLSVLEKEYAEIIFIWYLSGKKIQTLGAAGGVSSTAVSQAADAVERQQGTTIPSATQSSTTTRVSPDTAFPPAVNIPRKLPESTKSTIRAYLDSYIPSSASAKERSDAKIEAIRQAEEVFSLPTEGSKLSKLQNLKRASGSSFSTQFTVKKAIYNSIRQLSVLKVIYPISANMSQSEINAKVPALWPRG